MNPNCAGSLADHAEAHGWCQEGDALDPTHPWELSYEPRDPTLNIMVLVRRRPGEFDLHLIDRDGTDIFALFHQSEDRAEQIICQPEVALVDYARLHL